MANNSQIPENKQDGGNGRRTVRTALADMYRAAVASSFGTAYQQRGLFASQTGLSFDGQRDMYANLGYPRILTPKMFRERYERGDIAERIVEAYPRATWTAGAMIVEDPAPNVETKFEKEVDVLFERLDVWARLLRADILAGLGQYSVLLMGTEGELATEMPRLRSQEQILYLTPLPEENAQIDTTVTDTANERFGQPEIYSVKFETGRTSKVHWTRLIHIAEGVLTNDTYGKPRLRSIWNRLNDLEKIVGGGSEAAWKNMDRGMQLDLDPEVVLNPAGEEALMEEVEEYINGSRRFMRTRGVTLNQLGATAVGFGPNVDSILMIISATTGIPHRILTGSERGELASTNDRNNWNDRNAERQREFAEPVTTTFLDRLIEFGALPEPVEYEVIWPDFEEMDEEQKSTIADKYAKANSSQKTAGDTVIVTSNEIRQNLLGLDPLEEVVDEEDLDDDPPVDDQQVDELPPEEDDEDVEDLRAAADNTDEESDRVEWQAVHAAADKNEPRFTRLFTSYWNKARANIDGGRLVRALSAGSVEGAANVVYESLDDATVNLSERLPDYYATTIVDSGSRSLVSYRERGSWYSDGTNPTIELRGLQDEDGPFIGQFDSSHEGTITWARNRTASLVTEIDPTTREAIRIVIANGIDEGIAPRALARQVRRIVGLRTDQIEALENFSKRKGVTAKQIDRYREKLLRDRAVLISRSETMRAANQGQRQLWKQAIEANLLPADQLRVFIATPDGRTRDAHAEADGEVTGVDEEFPSGIEPGVEPRCRCAEGLASPKDVERYQERIAA